MRCCQLAVIRSEPISVEDFDGDKALEGLEVMAQPPITQTCHAIRQETLRAFYGSNEFRFVDTGISFNNLPAWFYEGWQSYWPLVKCCTVSSDFDDVKHALIGAFFDQRVTLQEMPRDGDDVLLRLKVEDSAEDSQVEGDVSRTK